MPRRSRNRLVWSIDQVCRETSFSREVVVHLMTTNVLPSMLYQGDRCTTPKAVDRLLQELIDGCHQDVCIAGRYPFRSSTPTRPAKQTTKATEAALAFIEEAIAQVGGKSRRHVQHGGERSKRRRNSSTTAVEAC